MIGALDSLALMYRGQQQNLARWRVAKAPFSELDESIKQDFSDPGLTEVEKIQCLLSYLWQANQHYLSDDATLAYYPGLPSIYGARNDGIEGVSRLLPLWAACLNSPLMDAAQVTVVGDSLKRSLLNGTDPQSAGYWGKITDRCTLICEAADIALALWLSRSCVWPQFSIMQQQQILTWLKQVPNKQTADNNWHLFVVLVDKVVAALDSTHSPQSEERYVRIKSFYQGRGCFRDGESGEIDLYNAWCFHYLLYWIDRIDPDYDRDFIHRVGIAYSQWFRYLFTDKGMPLFGRSLCYRMAMPVPVLAASVYDSQQFLPGESLQMLFSCWAYFIENDGLKLGRPTQGIFADDERWLDPYSGPASSLWGVRSLVLFFSSAAEMDWQRIQPLPLPAQTEARKIDIQEVGMSIMTEPHHGLSRLIFQDNDGVFSPDLIERPKFKERLKERLFAIAHRPANNLLKKGVKEFDSKLTYYR